LLQWKEANAIIKKKCVAFVAINKGGTKWNFFFSPNSYCEPI
jgi:hypothetical protein